MEKANKEIRLLLKNNNLTQWQVADYLNLSPYTINVWLRTTLKEEQEKLVTNAINHLIKENA